jgi:hypothetical protein
VRGFSQINFGADTLTHEWATPGSDDRGVFLPDANLFSPTAWQSPTAVDATVVFLDGFDHAIALYFVDFDRKGAIQLVQVLDGDSGAILDQRVLDDMGEGIYLSWKARGWLRFHIQRQTQWPATTSGIFIGGPIPTSQFWWARNFGDLLATPQWNDDPDADGRPNIVEYALGTNPLFADAPATIDSRLANGLLTMDLSASHTTSDVIISAETSTDLLTWQAAPVTRSDTDEFVRFTTPTAGSAPRFYRLRFRLP